MQAGIASIVDPVTAFVTLTSFGQGRFRFELPGRQTTVGDVLGHFGIDPGDRRVAVNGHVASRSTVVFADDEISSVPRVQGG